MTRPHRTLALASLLTILLTLLGANAASAEDRPSEPSLSVATQAPVVGNHGLDSQSPPNRASLQGSCYENSLPWDAGGADDGATYWVPGGFGDWREDPFDRNDPDYGHVYVTSANCKDINIQLTNSDGPVLAKVCWTSGICNPAKTISGRRWQVLASGIPDGWSYYVRFEDDYGYLTGRIAD